MTDLLRRSPQLPNGPVSQGDIAVLLRTNTQVASVVAELRSRDIRAIGSTTDLLSTREGQFVAAGLAAVLDPDDSVALAELVTLMPDHSRHDTWFEDTARITDKEQRHKRPQEWWHDLTLTALSELAVNAAHHSSVELLLANNIDALDLPQRIKSWTTSESRLATLDALCQIAGEYEDAAHQTRMPVTPAGLLEHLKEAATAYEQTSAHDAVLVTTMHQSKGLQWPVVVVGIPINKDYGHREINVEKAPDFDARHPLANRSLRYLPGVLKNFAPLKQRLGVLGVVSRAQDAEDRETARLLYVALTRAECHSIMAFGDPVGRRNVLSASVDDELLQWNVPTATDGESIAVNEAGTMQLAVRRRTDDDGGANPHTMPIRINAYSLEAGDDSEKLLELSAPSFYAAIDIPARRPAEAPLHLPARFTASGVPSDGVKADVALIADLGEPLVAKGGKDWDRIGDAVHAYLGLPLSRLSDEAAAQAAERILSRWDAGRVLTPETLIELGNRWMGWIGSTYPDTEVDTESPIALRNDEGQVMEGWIDSRLVLPNGGHILIDHKSYPGADPIGHISENYLGQLEVYAQATQATVGRFPERVLIHLPLLGAIAEVRLPVAQATTR